MRFEVYCDESRQENFVRREDGTAKQVLIGGIWIEAVRRQEYKDAIRELRDRHRVGAEFKWNRVSPSRGEFYRGLVDLFFESEMRFRCIVLPANELDAVTFAQADDELMFYKFYYQLIHHWILDFNDYRVFVDIRTNRVHDRLRTLERCLANANLTSTISVQALPSEDLDILQLADVLIGAVGYRSHLGTSRAKLGVVEAVEAQIGHRIAATTRGEEKFNIFHFRPGGGW